MLVVAVVLLIAIFAIIRGGGGNKATNWWTSLKKNYTLRAAAEPPPPLPPPIFDGALPYDKWLYITTKKQQRRGWLTAPRGGKLTFEEFSGEDNQKWIIDTLSGEEMVKLSFEELYLDPHIRLRNAAGSRYLQILDCRDSIPRKCSVAMVNWNLDDRTLWIYRDPKFIGNQFLVKQLGPSRAMYLYSSTTQSGEVALAVTDTPPTGESTWVFAYVKPAS